ncbi:hypothetical protein, partial [Bradyrhizobium liaoningense]|uniref:hypothetical protein n=2 Tax=Bradyrhizobium liaoningense TaxID=43992 RepID=UPI001BAB5192
SSSSLLIRSKNPRRCQAENPLKLLSEFAGPALTSLGSYSPPVALDDSYNQFFGGNQSQLHFFLNNGRRISTDTVEVVQGHRFETMG